MNENQILECLQGYPELIVKFERFKKFKAIDRDPLFKWCPKPDCENYVKAISET